MKKKLLTLSFCSIMAVSTAVPTMAMETNNATQSGITVTSSDSDRLRAREIGDATVVNCTTLTVRSTPNGTAIGWLNAGTNVVVCDYPGGERGWTYIQFKASNGQYTYGYVGSSYITPNYY